MDTIAWHYTFSYKATQIITAGHLRKCPVKPLKGEPQGVWFSTNPIWENTVRKQVVLMDKKTGKQELTREPMDKDELHEITGYSAIRFAIDCTRERHRGKLHSWNNYRKKLLKAGLAAYAKQLKTTAILWKADPKEWLIYYGDVTLFDLINDIEMWDHVGGRGWMQAKLRVDDKTRKVEVVPLLVISGLEA